MKKLITLLILLLSPEIALAEFIYLECEMIESSETKRLVTVTIDKERMVINRSAPPAPLKAIFSPGEIKGVEDVEDKNQFFFSKISTVWTLDRKTLSVVEKIEMTIENFGEPKTTTTSTSKGTCKILETKENKI